MAKCKVVGMEIFNKQLDRLASEANKINRGALGDGAGYVAGKIREALESMPVREDKFFGTDGFKLVGATESEKSQIIENFGIAKFKENSGGPQTSIGFYGYVNTPSTRFNDQVPTGMLMQCINYGTSFRNATHTVDRATRGIQKEVEEVIQKYIDKEVEKIIK